MQIERIRREAGSRGRALMWLNLLCLDAPLVAVVWQAAFASTFNVTLPMGSQVALFLTAWLIYLGDRLADVLSIKAQDLMSARQAFCFYYRRHFFFAIAGIGLLEAWLIVSALEERLRLAGAAIGGVAIAYLTVNHSLGRIWRVIPVKELSIGSLFTLGTVVGVMTRMTKITAAFYLATILFGCLCTFNCVCIATWERALDRAQAKFSIATRFLVSHNMIGMVGFGCAAIAVASATAFHITAGLISCIAISFACLALLDFADDCDLRDEHTALADLALLTPIGFLIAQRL